MALPFDLLGRLARASDRLLYRHPFEGRSARRYAASERPAFADLDDRLLDGMALPNGAVLLDLGCGPAGFARRAKERDQSLVVLALDPSRDFAADSSSDATTAARGAIRLVRAAGEMLPLRDQSVDVAMCLSSIRHVRDRAATLRELRRVVRDRVVIVELDPVASPGRIASHADLLGSALLRAAFGPLVVRTAPQAETIVQLARDAGFTRVERRDDPLQPVYILDLR
ncbi:MAG TPA: methyltransferase domain-containing protein [Kofleriaceae bacterium]